MSVNSETGLHPSLEFSSRSVLSFTLLAQVLTSYLAPRVAPVRSLFTVSRKQKRLILFREAILHEIKDFGKRRQIRCLGFAYSSALSFAALCLCSLRASHTGLTPVGRVVRPQIRFAHPAILI